MYPLRRYVKRILIPFLVVALIAIVGRLYLMDRFAEESVRVADPGGNASKSEESPNEGQRGDFEIDASAPAFSEEAKRKAVKRAQTSLQALVSSPLSSDDNGRQGSAEEAQASAAAAIDRLENADADNWPERYETAFTELQQYAKSIGSAAN